MPILRQQRRAQNSRRRDKDPVGRIAVKEIRQGVRLRRDRRGDSVTPDQGRRDSLLQPIPDGDREVYAAEAVECGDLPERDVGYPQWRVPIGRAQHPLLLRRQRTIALKPPDQHMGVEQSGHSPPVRWRCLREATESPSCSGTTPAPFRLSQWCSGTAGPTMSPTTVAVPFKSSPHACPRRVELLQLGGYDHLGLAGITRTPTGTEHLRPIEPTAI